MKHTECKDCKLREYEDCGYHHRIDGDVYCDIPSLSSCDKYGNCMFFQPKPKAKRNSKRTKGEWIPISERLPEQANQSYLVTVDYGNDLVCSCQRFFFGEDIGWNDDCVIAWQELPEPYRKGGAE